MNTLDLAFEYRASGISVLPICPDTSKAPAIKKWNPYRNRMATDAELRSFFDNGNGIGAIGGKVSGNLEIFDFDDAKHFEEWAALIKEHLGEEFIGRLVIVRTPRPGYHVHTRSNSVGGNKKLAMKPVPDPHHPGRMVPKTMIETKAEGGYVLLPGCPPACHETGRTYEVIQGTFDKIPQLSPEERDVLLTCARSFNEVVRESPALQQKVKLPGLSPGDDFASRTSWEEILRPHGYKVSSRRGEVTLWTRPGKEHGPSASTNYAGSDLFYPFSTNCYPFESERGYNKLAVHAFLNHNGNFHAAAKELARQGYGDAVGQRAETRAAVQASIEDDERFAIQEEGCSVESRPEAADMQGESIVEETPYIEFAPAFLSVEDPPAQYLVNDLLPEGVLTLMHGEPRSRKTWAALDLAIALATGTPFAGLERFSVSEPVPVLYSSQEDSAYWVRLRAKALLRGRGIDQWPETLAFSVHRGINLESPEWHERLLTDISRYGFRFVALDPVRRFAVNVDKGPAEVRQITAYLRRLCTETGSAIGLVHHDVKPPANGKDERRRSHRASGGDWFAACECPIHFEGAGDITLVRPEDFKVSSDPAPFSYRLETDDSRNPTIARLIGETTSAEEAEDLGRERAILTYLTEQKRASSNKIRKAVRGGRDEVAGLLERMVQKGTLDRTEGSVGKATYWFIREVKS